MACNQDLYHIAWLLRQKLIPDLVPPIMEHADLFDKQVCSNTEYRVIDEREAPMTAMLTPILRTKARLKHPFRSVDFTIVSKDQGWVGDRNGGSWTWFSAGVVKDMDEESLEEVTCERDIVRNPIAGREYTTHRVHWNAFSEDPAEAAWVRALRDGDKIVVRAWARFGGWRNFVNGVEVRVAAAVVTR